MINILIYSNESEIADRIKKVISKRKERMNLYYSSSVSGLLLFNLARRDMDIIFMCIHSMMDIKVAERYKVYNYKSLIIFITTEDLADKLFGIESFRCLTDTDGLEEAVHDAFVRISLQRHHFFKYEKNRSEHGISLDSVQYFYSTHKTINIKKRDGNEESFPGRLDVVQRQVDNKCAAFLRLNKSYLINRKYVEEREGNIVKMMDGTLITVSRNYHILG